MEDTSKEIIIQVVEDDKFMREVMTTKLVQDGFTVTPSEDGAAALAAMRERRPHLVLLDIMLPGMDGFDVLKYMREDKQLSAVPVVVLSNRSSQEDIDRAAAFGVNAFLVKAQVTPGEIVEKIKEILNASYTSL